MLELEILLLVFSHNWTSLAPNIPQDLHDACCLQMFGIMTIYLFEIGNKRLFSTLVNVDEKETQVMEERGQ